MLDFLQNILPDAPDSPALFALRKQAMSWYDFLPTHKTEAYKYTRVTDFLTKEMCAVSLKKFSQHTEHCTCASKKLSFDAYEICFCNGMLHAHFHPIDGVEVCSLEDAIKDHEITKYINKFEMQKFPFAAMNTAYLAQGVVLRFSKTPNVPVALFYKNDQNGMKNIRNIIIVEEGVKAELLEIFEGNDAPYFSNVVNEIFIARHADLKHYKLQNEGKNAVHICLNHLGVKENGQYASYTLQTGSKLARNETHVLLKEKGAKAIVNGAYQAKENMLLDTSTDILHISPATISEQNIRGTVDGSARGVFCGKIHIEPLALKTEGKQSHKALILSDNATVDVKPELEIFADDVKCSHGSTSGYINPEALFYLSARGIDDKTAQRLLISSFCAEPFATISNEKIKTLFLV